jgi:membrane glycosyltransferase
MRRSNFLVFAVAIGVILYVALIIPVAFWPHSNLLFALSWVSLYAMLACGLSLEITELLLAFLWTQEKVEFAELKIKRRETAILITVCNDADEEALSALLSLREAGYPVFVLDDSSPPTLLPDSIRTFVTHISRSGRVGAKAGNLNHWLMQFGDSYENVVILDADCIISAPTVDKLVQASLHPTNSDVAIFQSKVIPRYRRSSTMLSFLLGIGARPRARVLERVHARLGLILSFGHNQLIRVAALKTVGGFSEAFTSEDTVLSLKLAALGLRTVLVDAWSYDTEPDSVIAYVRRTVRWARQTVELFCGEWDDCPLRLKLLLCRHLLSYLMPVVGFVLLLVSVGLGPTSLDEVIEFSLAALSFNEGYAHYGLAMWSTMVILALRLILQCGLVLAEGTALGPFLFSAFAGPSLQAILIIPVIWGMILSWLGKKAKFVPTNQHPMVIGYAKSFRHSIALCSVTGTIGVVLLMMIALRPGSSLVGFNFVWVFGFMTSPIVFTILSVPYTKWPGNHRGSGGTT